MGQRNKNRGCSFWNDLLVSVMGCHFSSLAKSFSWWCWLCEKIGLSENNCFLFCFVFCFFFLSGDNRCSIQSFHWKTKSVEHFIITHTHMLNKGNVCVSMPLRTSIHIHPSIFCSLSNTGISNSKGLLRLGRVTTGHKKDEKVWFPPVITLTYDIADSLVFFFLLSKWRSRVLVA